MYPNHSLFNLQVRLTTMPFLEVSDFLFQFSNCSLKSCRRRRPPNAHIVTGVIHCCTQCSNTGFPRDNTFLPELVNNQSNSLHGTRLPAPSLLNLATRCQHCQVLKSACLAKDGRLRIKNRCRQKGDQTFTG